MKPSDRTPGASAQGVCLLAVLCLAILQWLWPGRWLGATGNAGLTFAVLMSLPLVVLGWALWRKRASARFWSGVAALFYFCHGIAEAWAVPSSLLPGMTEALLSVVVVLASSWEGLRARVGARSRRNV